MTATSQPKAHAVLGASSCARWWNCPGSVRLTRHLRSSTSEYAKHGTAAHALCELCLISREDAEKFLGYWIDADTEKVCEVRSGPGAWFKVDPEMVEAVQTYLDTVRAEVGEGDTLWVEKQFSLETVGAPEPMFGTSDASVYKRASGRLVVIDFKYGAGLPVEVGSADGDDISRLNKQLLYYALGAAVTLPQECEVREVEIVIVQPRAPHPDGPVRRAVIDAFDLAVFAGDLMAAARRTQAADAPLAAGSWCKFCAALATCPERYTSAVAAAQSDFSGDLSDLTTDKIANILDKADEIEDWIKAVRAHAHDRLAADPASVPGWKLVPKRATRSWSDEEADDTVDALRLLGLSEEEIFEKKLRSPAKIEKLLPKDDRNALEALTVKESSGTTLARESDRRPRAGRASASDDFND